MLVNYMKILHVIEIHKVVLTGASTVCKSSPPLQKKKKNRKKKRLALMLMESQVKFWTSQNISGASQQKGIAAFS